MDPYALSSRMREATRSAGVTTKATCHILLHSFVPHLATTRVPLHQIKAYLGHAHIETTMVYAHLTPISHESAIGLIDELIKPILRR